MNINWLLRKSRLAHRFQWLEAQAWFKNWVFDNATLQEPLPFNPTSDHTLWISHHHWNRYIRGTWALAPLRETNWPGNTEPQNWESGTSSGQHAVEPISLEIDVATTMWLSLSTRQLFSHQPSIVSGYNNSPLASIISKHCFSDTNSI